MRAAWFLLLLATVAAPASVALAQPDARPVSNVASAEEVTIAERLGAQVPLDVALTNSEGETVRLGDYLGQEKPVVLAFVYHNCPMLCSLILDGYADALRETDLAPGDDFEALAVSFDARDDAVRAAEAKARYVAEVEGTQPTIADHWHFLTGDAAAVERLANAVGFTYFWDEVGQQYAHNAALIVLSPDGTITRYLYGIEYAPRDFRLALVEGGQGTIGSALDRLLLTCFQYDAGARAYTPVVLNIMKLGGVLLLLALAAMLIPLWRRERRRSATPVDPATLGTIHGLTD